MEEGNKSSASAGQTKGNQSHVSSVRCSDHVGFSLEKGEVVHTQYEFMKKTCDVLNELGNIWILCA